LYVNRTYFGIYSIMTDLDATIHTGGQDWKHKLLAYHDLGEAELKA